MSRRRVEAQAGDKPQAGSISIPTTSIVVPVTALPVRKALVAAGLAVFREGRR